MRSTKVLILHNQPVLAQDHPDADSEWEILYTSEEVAKHLVKAGHTTARLGVGRDPSTLIKGIREHQPDVVFNLYEGLADDSGTEAYMAGLLECLQIPYTGCPFQTLALGRTKHLTKFLLKGAGISTADFFLIDDLPVLECPLEFPVMVKPATQDASVGIDQSSVVTCLEKLEERAAYLLESYGGPVLVEEFIRGRELNVAIVEDPNMRVLPISEVLFVDKDPDFWPIVTYDAKWKPGTRDYESTPPKYPAELTPRLRERISQLAQSAYRILGCRDYARVDFRVKPSGKAYVLEVNPNPDFSPTAGLTGALESAGSTHEQFTLQLVENALERNVRAQSVTAGGRSCQPACPS